MKKTYVTLPDSFVKGLLCKVYVSLNGKSATKELKVCTVKARSITFMEVDKVNRQNIFRKVDRTDIVGFGQYPQTGICEINVRDGILPVKWESAWDSIGQPSSNVRSYGRFAQAARPSLTNYSSYMKPSTTNSAAGFPMV